MLQLNDRQISELESALHVCLSPLDYPGLSEWRRATLEQVRKVVDAHHAALWIPDSDGLLTIEGVDIDAATLALLHESQQRVLTGSGPDKLMRQATRARSRGGSGVYHERDLTDRETVEGSPIYQEVFRPVGIRYTMGMSARLPEGEGVVVMAFNRSDAEGFQDAGLARLRLLLPAFVAGCTTAYHFAHQRESLGRVLDGLREPIFLLRKDGEVLYENEALIRLLSREPQSERLLDAIRAHAEALRVEHFTSNQKTKPVSPPGAPSTTVFNARARRYQLHGSYVGAEVFGRGAVMVVVHPVGWRGLSRHYARKRYGLTPREVEVAALLAEGMTNQGIGDALQISPHTVKHHVSHIMRKLDVASRSAVVARLLRVEQ